MDEQCQVRPRANELVLEEDFSENIVAGVPHPRIAGNWMAAIMGAKVDEGRIQDVSGGLGTKRSKQT